MSKKSLRLFLSQVFTTAKLKLNSCFFSCAFIYSLYNLSPAALKGFCSTQNLAEFYEHIQLTSCYFGTDLLRIKRGSFQMPLCFGKCLG